MIIVVGYLPQINRVAKW